MSQPTQAAALQVVLDYHQAWTSGDIDRAVSHVADDLTCRVPGEELSGKDEWRAYLGGFAPSLTGLTDVAHFVDGARVVLLYYPHTAVTSSAPAAEYFTVRDGVIVDLLLVFDRLSFSPPVAP
jgi:ketosteroid isomerase-like protein